MIEIKPCKGQHKAHGAEACGKDTDVKKRKFGLCPVCYWNWMQNAEAGKVHYQKQFIKKVEVKTKQERKRKKVEFKESIKSIAALIQDARKPFQEFVRIRDANDGCISCGTITAKMYHGGHYLKAELYTGLIFNEINCNKQCEKCNTFGGGNESGYRIGLVKKYGEKAVKELEESANHLRQYKFSKDELRRIKSIYKSKVKELKG